MPSISENTVQAIERELKILISAEQIAQRVAELAEEICTYVAGERLVAIAAMSGGFMFLADLVRHLRPTPIVDFVHVQIYGAGTRPAEAVTLLRPFDRSLEGQHVLVVEDIIDTGRTARFLLDLVRGHYPSALSFVALLDKKPRREVPVAPDFVGFEIGDHFVVGYGLDYAGLFRALPDICVLPRWVGGDG